MGVSLNLGVAMPMQALSSDALEGARMKSALSHYGGALEEGRRGMAFLV